MASYPAERGRGSGGRARECKGRRDFPDMRDNRGERSNYDLRNTSSERYQRYEHTQEYSSEYQQGGRGTKETWKGNPKNKNTHIEYFWRTESPFSQFHPAIFDIQNERFVCAEQYMMSNKARLFSDHNSLWLIMQTQDPKTMQKYGRGVDNFDTYIWDMCCRQIVQEGNTAKFSQNFALLEKMLSTENKYFAESYPGDRKWGIGMAENNPLSNNPDSWMGRNWIGEALNMVKYEFQLIIFVTMNGKRIIQAPKSSLFDLFKIGTCEYFEKMKCEILITHSEEETFIDATAKPSKNRSGKEENKKDKQAKIVSRVNEEEETLARNYDVQPPKSLKEKEQSNVEAKVLELEKVTEKIDTAVESSKEKFAGDFEKTIIDQREEEINKEITPKDESTNQKEMTLPNSGEEKMKENVQKAQEIPKESKQIDDSVSESQNCNEDNKTTTTTTTVGNKQKQSPLTERKYQSEQVDKQEKIKFEPTKITFGSIPVIKTKIPNSKRISCEYIFTDWARAKICSDVTILNCFMGLSVEEIHKFPGNCIYQTNNEVLAIGINISSLLIQLQKEFNGLRSIFQENPDVIKQFDCATNIPYPPSLKEEQRVDTETRDIWLLPSSQLDSPVVKNIEMRKKKSDISAMESAEIPRDKTDTSAKESAEIPQDITDTPAKESAEIPQDITDTPAKESAEIPQDITDTPAKESAEIPQDTTDTPAMESAEIPQDKTDTPAKENAEIPQDKTDTPAMESAEIPQDKTDTPAKESAEIPQDITVTPAMECAEIPQDKTDTPAMESAEIPQDKSDTPAKESAEISRDKTDISIMERVEVSQDKSGNAFEEVQITANKPDTKIAIIPVNPTTVTTETEDRAENSTANKKPESEEEVISVGHTETGINKSDINASEMDVTAEFIPVTNTSSSLPDGEQIEEQKPKERCSYSGDETSTAKRLKQSTEAKKQLVSYNSSSDSDQASFENQNTRTEKILSKTGKKHSISEESTDNKRAKSEPLPEIKFPDENEINEKDEPKEKPNECISESSGKSKKKKKKKKIISSTPLH